MLQNAVKIDEPPPGWLGLEPMQTGVDWKLFADLGAESICVAVSPFSPAARAGIQSGDFVHDVDGKRLEAFLAAPPAVGSRVIVRVHRPGRSDDWLFDPVLIERPKASKPADLAPIAARSPAVECGAPVKRQERYKWLQKLTAYNTLQPIDKALATRLAVRFSNAGGKCWPAHGTLAKDMGVTTRTIIRALARLNREGLVLIASGRKRGVVSNYTLTWPASAGSNIVSLSGLPP